MKRFTLIELLVVVSIIAILASLLLPALSNARRQARLVMCLNNQRQVLVGIMTYTDSYDGHLPGPTSTHNMIRGSALHVMYGWDTPETEQRKTLGPAVLSGDIHPSVLYCPGAADGRPVTYNWTGGPFIGTGTTSMLTWPYHANMDPYMPAAGANTCRMMGYHFRPTVDPGPLALWGGIHSTWFPQLNLQPVEKGFLADYLDCYDWHNARYNVGYPDGHAKTVSSPRSMEATLSDAGGQDGIRSRMIWDFLYEDDDL
jgi:prepilin-type N-terminal cleavage/methylation domain-containing protein/prepilin-type processing-associated H-X9-DG protein